MNKAKSLRAALTAAIPELRNEPGRLKLWIENGAVRARGTASHGFAMQYPLSVLIEEASTDIAIIALAITRWLRVNQPDLLAPNGDSFQFESDILDLTTADILFTINLTENIAVAPQQDGSWQVTYLDEPDPLFGEGEGFAGVAPIPLLAEVKLSDA
ncbi:MAG: phage tail protein [Erythrobacter sp.]|uniref:phage tail protein n=1 Tax=Erythrobacter sp. TaxID=1042 RepID=UPI0025E80976|nr:phage tail protein [Erythrobacter sp.]MCM0001020.1 phage tail protein [Erythrobacter sp.]